MKLTEKELDRLRRIADELQLDGRELLFSHDLEYINAHCNGIGPAHWASGIRAVISKLHKSATLAAMIHDLWWDSVTDTEKAALLGAFNESNNAFERNALKLADYHYGWYNPLRYLARNEARKFHGLLDMFGYRNFLEAVAKNSH